MNKVYFSSLFIITLIILFTYYIYNTKQNVFNFLSINNNILKLTALNKDFDLFLTKTTMYNNFDIIKDEVFEYNDILNQIINNKLLLSIDNKELQSSLIKLKHTSSDKYEYIQYYKSYRAIINNSNEIINKLNNKKLSFHLLDLYIKIRTLNLNNLSDTKSLIFLNKKVKYFQKQYNNKNDKLFLLHSNIILKYQINLFDIKEELFELELEKKLSNFQRLYELHSTNEINNEKILIILLVSILLFLLFIYLIYEFKLSIVHKSLTQFKLTLENSDNIIMITNENKIITYVNKIFTNVYGYNKEEAIGQKADFLKSDKLSKKFYKDLSDTLNSGKKWHGELINQHKNGTLIYEKVTITPSFNEKGEIQEYIAIKLDITHEVKIRNELIKKEKMLNHQSKMASMGEMLENIAHQWNQPLSLITTTTSAILLQKELKMNISLEEEVKYLTSISNTIVYLSQTIRDFRYFFNTNKEKVNFDICDTYKNTFSILSPKFESMHIKVIENITSIHLNSFDTELMQVIINLLNNAKDVLENKNIKEKLIFINIYNDDKYAYLSITDNAGGIPNHIIDNIFEPYFTTKHKSQGTGIGLYMSLEIISKHMKGSLIAKNCEFTYNNTEFKGAKFTIKIPL